MSDLISRQDAINKCQERLYESALNNVGYECEADEVFADIAQKRIKTWLNEVPSAQPEQECEKCIFKPFKQFQPDNGLTEIADKEYIREVFESLLGLVKFEWPDNDYEIVKAFIEDIIERYEI